MVVVKFKLGRRMRYSFFCCQDCRKPLALAEVKEKMKTLIKYHLPAILYAVLIIVVSSIPSLTPPKVGIVGMDKIAHFFEYAILAVLVFRSISHLSPRIRPGMMFLLSMLFIVIFAIFDEAYQAYVPGRKSDLYDIVFDLLGSMLILGYLWYRNSRSRRTD